MQIATGVDLIVCDRAERREILAVQVDHFHMCALVASNR